MATDKVSPAKDCSELMFANVYAPSAMAEVGVTRNCTANGMPPTDGKDAQPSSVQRFPDTTAAPSSPVILKLCPVVPKP
jgi:hypothetical protein